MRKNMLIMGICLITLASWPVQRAMATDYTLLETLIAAHKRQSNRLKERTETASMKMGTGNTMKNSSTNYTDVVKKVSQRMGDLYSYLTFASEMVRITNLTKEVVKMEADAMDLSLKCGVEYPQIAEWGLQLHHDFGVMTVNITNMTIYVVSSGLNMTMATMKQRKDFTDYISSELSTMKRKLRRFNYYAELQMMVGVNRGLCDYYKEVKHSEIVDKIKKEFSVLSSK